MRAPAPLASLALVSLQAPNFHSPIPGRPGEGTAPLDIAVTSATSPPAPLISFSKQVARLYQVSPAARLTGSSNATPPLGDYQPRGS